MHRLQDFEKKVNFSSRNFSTQWVVVLSYKVKSCKGGESTKGGAFLSECIVESEKSETLKNFTALNELVFDTCRYYWVVHEPKFFQSCLDLGGTAIIFPKSDRNQKWKKNY